MCEYLLSKDCYENLKYINYRKCNCGGCSIYYEYKYKHVSKNIWKIALSENFNNFSNSNKKNISLKILSCLMTKYNKTSFIVTLFRYHYYDPHNIYKMKKNLSYYIF
jgi:hypothetical protein